jgi:hypothetical protein
LLAVASFCCTALLLVVGVLQAVHAKDELKHANIAVKRLFSFKQTSSAAATIVAVSTLSIKYVYV